MKIARFALVSVLSVSALSLGGCRKSEDSEKKADTKAATTTATAEEKKAARPKPPPVDEGIDVPTEEDFEEAVATEISDTSDLQKELDKLEKEIGK
jgi:hypothetical protein